MIDHLCIIIGAMKAATTSLYELLSEHPGICRNSLTKEPNFFADAVLFDKGWSFYESQWQYDPARHAVALESSTRYTKFPMTDTKLAASRMRGTGRRFDLIYVVRDPIDRIASHVRHQLGHGLVEFPSRFKFLDLMVQTSQYGMQLREFRSGYPDAPIMLIDFARLVADPAPEVARCISALGLPAHAVQDLGKHNLSQVALSTDEIFSAGQIDRLRLTLRPDMEIFRQDWGFDVSRWGF